MSGHIDATGKILGIREDDNAVWYRIGADYKTTKIYCGKGFGGVRRYQPDRGRGAK